MSAASISRPRPARGSTTSGRSGAASGARALPQPRVRWDRLGRFAMLFVLGVLLYLYLSAGIRMLSTWDQARTDRSAVSALEVEHDALVREHESLGRQGTIEGYARRLGMMKKGEQQYIVTGLPHD
jgi:hypothetical protein